jgi:hypothetical protein
MTTREQSKERKKGKQARSSWGNNDNSIEYIII